MQFALEPIYGSITLTILLAVIALATVLLVTPTAATLHQRRILMLLRIIATTVLLLSCFRPTIVRSDNRPADAVIAIAVDTSQSMTLPDGKGSTRYKTQSTVLEELAAGLSIGSSISSDDGLQLRYLEYGESTASFSDSEIDSIVARQPDGQSTDLSAALRESINSASGQPIAGIVLIGDGVQTTPAFDGGATSVAQTLRAIGVPLWAIPIGPAESGTETRDVAVESLSDSLQLFAGNQFDIDFTVKARGISGTELPLRIAWIDDQGQATEVQTRRVLAEKASETVALTTTIQAPEPGTYQLVVEVEQQDGETITSNNRQIAFVEVRDGGGRILYLEGNLSQEYRFLRRALLSFADLDLVSRWIPTDTRDAWPVELPELNGEDRFDAYILGDLDASAIGKDQLQRISDAVATGAGLITLGGEQVYGVGGYATSPLSNVLPIRMDQSRRADQLGRTTPGSDSANALPAEDATIDPNIEIRVARSHPITSIGGQAGSEIDTWMALPPQLGAYPWLGAKVAPGVDVLLESPDRSPLLVIGSSGRGRVAAVAFDSTYQWWRNGRSDVHKRFWRQVVLWLLSREESGRDKIRLAMDARRFATGQEPSFTATLDSVSSQTDPDLTAVIVSPSGKIASIDDTIIRRSQNRGLGNDEADKTSPVQVDLTGTVPELSVGIYRLRVSSADSQVEPAELAFQVIEGGLELSRPSADPVFLTQLAEVTADEGGQAFAPDQVNDLLDAIAKRRKMAETPVIEKQRLGDTAATGWPLFIIFAAALSAEWFLRRRWNLA